MADSKEVVMWAGQVMLTYLHDVGNPASVNSPIGDDSVVGYMTDVLQVGRRLFIMSPDDTQDAEHLRVITTSVVRMITKTNDYTYYISTNNSKYRLDFLPDRDSNAVN